MKLNISFLDNTIEFSNENISVLEIENRDYFYRIVGKLNDISLGYNVEDVCIFGDDYKEINLCGKVNIIFDFFNFNFNSKKMQSLINKKINENINDVMMAELSKLYEKIRKAYLPVLNDFDLNLNINSEFDVELMIKLLNISICSKENILENLLLLLDVEKVLGINEIIIFINLKQYLNNEELVELYKYSVYNNIRILLIDSQAYGIKNEFERKLIVDEKLEEFLI